MCLALVALFLLVPAGPAAGSCVLPPRTSPHAFTGTVVAVSHGGREATVRLPDGGRAVVVGGPPGASATSVDRVYAVGATYEFHPLDATSPFQDNACTATRQLSGPVASTAGGTGADRMPARLPVEQGSLVSWLPVAGVVAIGGLALVVALAVRRRRPAPR